MISASIAFVAVAFASLASAQTPVQLSPLLIEPLLDNGKCMTASSNTNGASVSIQACTGASSQQWSFKNGQVQIFGSKCLDVTNGVNADGTKLQIWTCDTSGGNKNQQWYFTTDLRLAWTDHGKCTDLTGGSTAAGNVLQVWECTSGNSHQVWNVGYAATVPPTKSENGQTGTNNCGTTSSQSSMCQTAWINDVDDFCLWAPPTVGDIGDTEEREVAWCTKTGRGTRTIPNGTLKGVHFVRTPDYVQVTGAGDFTKINVPNGDEGGELDPHGATGNGNPIGGLVYGNTFGTNLQYHEWTSFISYNEFCFRACIGANAAKNCNHIYDVLGCYWNMPANYDTGVYESCKGDDDLPMGVYGTSTFYQGQNPTPPPHPAAKSSDCSTLPTVTSGPVVKKRDLLKKRVAMPEPGLTPVA